MLIAATKDEIRISLLDTNQSKQELVRLRRSNGFICPICRAPVMLKMGTKRHWHFAHLPHQGCHIEGEPETPTHLSGKEDLFRWCQDAGRSPKLEHYLCHLQQRPDIYLPGIEPVAIEYQCSLIPEDLFVKRSYGYLNDGITPVWVIGANRFHKRRRTLKLSGFSALSIRQSRLFLGQHPFASPYYVCFYDSVSKYFLLATQLFPISKTRFISQENMINRSQIMPFQLTAPAERFSSKTFKEVWLATKRQWRLSPPTRLSNEEYALRNQVYQHRKQFSCVPGYVGLPLASAIYFLNSPFLWQMWLVLLMGTIESGCWFTTERIIRETEKRRMGNLFALRSLPLCPKESMRWPLCIYLDYLWSLGIAEKTGRSYRLKTGHWPELSLPTALQEDQRVLDRLELLLKHEK
ncbi:competence protein CoiA [Sporolactobacillus kofuensis]|uniref:Competence protein CoiA n=1 Tax=Sporolactobacillus kofuensis TaxID=269672 RepID=A0ABW1WDR7_9BACL|nr:competence protein CoiA family protein [Sporolactobacillus kofuensis]MCO7174515.1 competence protein CoiA family protein [Sporolactobacillus kofuensis]